MDLLNRHIKGNLILFSIILENIMVVGISFINICQFEKGILHTSKA